MTPRRRLISFVKPLLGTGHLFLPHFLFYSLLQTSIIVIVLLLLYKHNEASCLLHEMPILPGHSQPKSHSLPTYGGTIITSVQEHPAHQPTGLITIPSFFPPMPGHYRIFHPVTCVKDEELTVQRQKLFYNHSV
ncbi:hypothetical protein H112_07135 [Trichophyton rubrum D6]|uniref:Uncharacterized protein n=2 Tax=Trichophyton rubrum TaxID=5551 RepID=A0A080WF65_TRIRC|nr:uncharacterized protein TERG_11851 [Trichophyton rubrum CBS 118892]EZF11601.1 hypothetical protein H100_07160 [Trichophyton rubrum MR850]EZF38638.1 hypothetical protein H102_07120 [Trichophyton rubrum CBS 100081]EZF49262.1 hypothetical protein H103_07143 [Trichophyton rubrum CBS 288.86]EZF59890.1 hypothetical protein H104_07097 [Trichophyton rubrum CBS 289.86]EZF81238.1 hypothetical protein H110_07143 [Trichophyton rubrum MR1448]EZF91699.1 hypothetical protein H113_07196 [Trichophyton rubr